MLNAGLKEIHQLAKRDEDQVKNSVGNGTQQKGTLRIAAKENITKKRMCSQFPEQIFMLRLKLQ